MEISAILHSVNLNHDKYLSFWQDLVRSEGTATDIAEMNKTVSLVENFARSEGFDVKRYPFSDCADCLTVEYGEKTDPAVAVFLAHLDTVHKIGSFGEDPIRIEGNKFFGPGVIDCKGGAAIGLLAMKALKDSKCLARVRFIFTTDEEVNNRLGGEKEINFIKEMSKGHKFALNLEVGKKGEAVVSRKGIIRVLIKIKGRSAHSGIDYFSGISAVREASYKIIALEEKSGKDGMTFNCSCLRGGEVMNIVPDECSFTVDVRVKDIPSLAAAEKIVADIVNKSFVEGTVSEYKIISRRLPMMRDADTENLLNSLNKVCEKYGYGKLAPIESGGGSDSAYTQAAGVPTLCAMGATGDRCHTLEEYAEIDSLYERASLIAVFCAENVNN